MITLKKRLTAKTPRFFKKIRTIGLALAAVGGLILTSPVSLPAALVSIAGYIALAGGVMSTVSQATIEKEE